MLFKATALCKEVVSEAFKKELADELRDSPYSILIDETTDLSTNKLLAVVVRHYSDSADCVVDDLLGLVEVDSATGAGLFEAVEGKYSKISKD